MQTRFPREGLSGAPPWLKNFSSVTIHNAVVKAGEAVASNNFVQFTHEPRGYPLLAATQTARRPHEKGPDTLFHLPVSIAADWKTTVSSSASNCCSSINALVNRKTKRAFSLYNDAVRQQGQVLTVPVILASGALLPAACSLIWTLGRDNRFSDFESDCEKICRAHHRAMAKLLIHHGDQSLRRRPLATSGATSGTAGSQPFAPHSVESFLLLHGHALEDVADPRVDVIARTDSAPHTTGTGNETGGLQSESDSTNTLVSGNSLVPSRFPSGLSSDFVPFPFDSPFVSSSLVDSSFVPPFPSGSFPSSFSLGFPSGSAPTLPVGLFRPSPIGSGEGLPAHTAGSLEKQ